MVIKGGRLTAVFSRYDNHAVKLQNELELVREDLYGLIHARGTKPDNEDNIKPNEIKLTQENLLEDCKKNDMITVEKSVQTDLAEPLSIETSQIRPLTLDKFTHGVLEIAFQLHEKLSECHGRRRLEIIHHEKHTSELSRNHLEALKRVQEKQQKNLTEFKYRIQKATQQELGVLREEREKLLSQ
ncbi:unnamed protein product [Trichobilharzia regenti]|nr:unnamed protein product [Trichobilharzia regenti]